jgi:hypothetical protein
VVLLSAAAIASRPHLFRYSEYPGSPPLYVTRLSTIEILSDEKYGSIEQFLIILNFVSLRKLTSAHFGLRMTTLADSRIKLSFKHAGHVTARSELQELLWIECENQRVYSSPQLSPWGIDVILSGNCEDIWGWLEDIGRFHQLYDGEDRPPQLCVFLPHITSLVVQPHDKIFKHDPSAALAEWYYGGLLSSFLCQDNLPNLEDLLKEVVIWRLRVGTPIVRASIVDPGSHGETVVFQLDDDNGSPIANGET